ncbi:hypothetical protein [Sorangium sp. So ce233]|uniref:hypothetical protein n=1 Tax=Sorangium sp. So ce233 TaxID=3133290 RepID=UPI003F63D215
MLLCAASNRPAFLTFPEASGVLRHATTARGRSQQLRRREPYLANPRVVVEVLAPGRVVDAGVEGRLGLLLLRLARRVHLLVITSTSGMRLRLLDALVAVLRAML